MKRAICVLGATVAWLFAAPARADHTRSSDGFTPAFAASRAGAVVDLWPGKDNLAATIGAELQLSVATDVFLDMSFGGALANIHDAPDGGEYLSFSNPTIGLHFVEAAAPDLHLFAGAGVTIPVLHDPSPSVSRASFFGARIDGYYDADRFSRGHAAVRAAGGLEWRMAGPMFLRAEIRPVLYIPTSDRYPIAAPSLGASTGAGKVGVWVEQALELEARANVGLGAGARLQAVLMPTQDDLLQTVVEPFIALTPHRRGIYARVGFPLALDADLGFGFGEDKLAAVRFDVGGEW